MLAVLLLLGFVFVYVESRHRKTAYYQITHVPYYRVRFNLGRYGEYLIYQHLRKYERDGARFLFNVYVPNGEDGTSEIDVIMVSQYGVFVFESKNYSGWIFGSENQLNWYQTLPQGRGSSHKESFYNPVLQNKTHIKHMKALLGEMVPMHSIILFSDRCTLKKINLTSDDVYVLNRSNVIHVVSKISSQYGELLSEMQIQDIYENLYPYTQVDAELKEKHITEIQNKLHSAMPAQEVDNIQLPEKGEEHLYCPKCGGTLVLRTAKKGANAGNQFYGCSNFPKCRYIRNS